MVPAKERPMRRVTASASRASLSAKLPSGATGAAFDQHGIITGVEIRSVWCVWAARAATPRPDSLQTLGPETLGGGRLLFDSYNTPQETHIELLRRNILFVQGVELFAGAPGRELLHLVPHLAERELLHQGRPDGRPRLHARHREVTHREVELAADAVGGLVGAAAVQHLLVVERDVAFLEQAEPYRLGSDVLLVDGIGAVARLISADLEVAAVEGRVLRLGVRARQVDGGAHVDVDVLQRDEGRVQRRPRRVGRVGVERLLLRPRL
eukprot:scaffold64126_cov63-Phaeocystis_antarctica.AAC.2